MVLQARYAYFYCVYLLVFIWLLALTPLDPVHASWIEEPEGYRMDDFRSPVPETLQGVEVVTTTQAFKIWQAKKTIFIDVLPYTPKPKNLPKGMIFKEKKRLNIPDSYWLPNIGYGKLVEYLDRYFQENLSAFTKGDKAHPVLFYCQADCWMSWNAAKRAHKEYGYTHVYWFPDGMDGWSAEDHPAKETKPYKLEDYMPQ